MEASYILRSLFWQTEISRSVPFWKHIHKLRHFWRGGSFLKVRFACSLEGIRPRMPANTILLLFCRGSRAFNLHFPARGWHPIMDIPIMDIMHMSCIYFYIYWQKLSTIHFSFECFFCPTSSANQQKPSWTNSSCGWTNSCSWKMTLGLMHHPVDTISFCSAMVSCSLDCFSLGKKIEGNGIDLRMDQFLSFASIGASWTPNMITIHRDILGLRGS